MEQWIALAMIAAIFITLRDYMSLDIIKKYSYVNYIVYANVFVFIGTMVYVYMSGVDLVKPKTKDLFLILLRIFIVYMIIEPAIYYSIKSSKNPGYAKSIINLNTLFIFLMAVLFLKQELTMKGISGILLIMAGSYLIT
tara:strand:- start:24 stop:440 length:417 start_codon:yes stop_codon:yes gene_type:complete